MACRSLCSQLARFRADPDLHDQVDGWTFPYAYSAYTVKAEFVRLALDQI
jgi:hypothetical protein